MFHNFCFRKKVHVKCSMALVDSKYRKDIENLNLNKKMLLSVVKG